MNSLRTGLIVALLAVGSVWPCCGGPTRGIAQVLMRPISVHFAARIKKDVS